MLFQLAGVIMNPGKLFRQPLEMSFAVSSCKPVVLVIHCLLVFVVCFTCYSAGFKWLEKHYNSKRKLLIIAFHNEFQITANERQKHYL